MAQCEAVLKILLIGDSDVGKTCLMFRFADDTFSESFVSTVGIDFKMKTVQSKDNRMIRLQLWDTAGQEKFFAITRPYYRNANCVLLVYDVTKASSFENVKRWMNNIDNHAPDEVLRVLVANKCDLDDRRVVRRSDGERLAATYAVQYFETSAKTSMNVSNMFSTIVESLLEFRKLAVDSESSVRKVSICEEQNSLDFDKLKESFGNCCSL